MKLKIGSNEVVIACTVAGKQALKTSNMTPRERQFILLIDESSYLAEQALAHLAQKVNLQNLAEKGWVTYSMTENSISENRVSTDNISISPKELPLANQTSAAILTNTQDNIVNKKNSDKKIGAKALESFLTTYAKEPNLTASLPKEADNKLIDIKRLFQSEVVLDTTPTCIMPVVANIDNSMNSQNIAMKPQPIVENDSLEDIMIVQCLLQD